MNDYIVDARNLIVKFNVNSINYTYEFPLLHEDAQKILNQTLLLIDEYRLSEWGVEMGKVYQTQSSKVYDMGLLRAYLISCLDSLCDNNKVLNLTK